MRTHIVVITCFQYFPTTVRFESFQPCHRRNYYITFLSIMLLIPFPKFSVE